MSGLSTTAAGAGGGAVNGAATGAKVGGPWGALIGAGAGAVLGGGAGYLGGAGAKKRRNAQKDAENRYRVALNQYYNQSEAGNQQYRGALQGISQKGAAAHGDYLSQLGAAGSPEALQSAYGNQMAALQAAPAPGPALTGPLADQYGAEMNARTQAALSPMALGYAADANEAQQGVVGQQYGVQQSMFGGQAQRAGTFHDVGQADYNRALMEAQARYQREMGRAQNAGSEQMLYAGLLNSAMSLGSQAGSSMGGGAGKPSAAMAPPTQSYTDNGWYSKIPQTSYGSMAS